MPLDNLRTTCFEGISILRHEGLLRFIQAGLRELNLNHRGFYYYLNYLYKRSRRSNRTSDPLTILNVDPKQIHHRASSDLDRWKHIGEVRGGSWDRSDRALEDGSKYRSVIDRFENDTSWERTDMYRESFIQIENGETHWNGCRTVEDVERRINDIEELYKVIKKSGFKSQSEIHGKSVKSIVLSGSFDRSKTDIAVAIGRNGEFLFIDGNHRLAIARSLRLESIPVRIVVRHKEWHHIRENAKRAQRPEDLDEKTKRYLNHPDIKNVLSANAE